MPKYQPTKLTIRFVDSLPLAQRDPVTGRVLSYSVRDAVTKGLMVVVNANSKSFAVQRDLYSAQKGSDGRRTKLGTRRIRLGETSDFLSIDEARTKAAEVIAQLKAGIDPSAIPEPEAQPPAYTLGDAIEAYIEVCHRKGRRPSTIQGYHELTDRYLKGWTERPLEDVGNDPLGVDHLHRTITKNNGPVVANQTIRLVRAVYRSAQRKMRHLPPCPTDAVDYNEEKRRTVIIEDWPLFWATVQGLKNPVTRDWFLFLAFTGMRKGAACEARVEHLDLESGFLHVPDPKGGPKRAFDLPLSGFLVELLRKRVEENRQVFGEKYPWLFPSPTSRTGHVTEARGCDKPGLVNPHALRHSYASAAAASGLDQVAIQLLLNHKLPGVTARYIHGSVLGQTLREAQERVTAWLLGQVRGQGNVVPMRRAANG